MRLLFTNVRHYSKKVAETTMRYLCVAEKNDAAKSIASVLSNNSAQRFEGLSKFNKLYKFSANVRGQNAEMIMTSVSGHLLTHEFVYTYKSWQGCDPISLFEAKVEKQCPENFIKVKQTLEREIRKCDGLIIWTDCDREGENIGFEIIDVCRAVRSNIQVFRAKFSEITYAGIRRALNTLGEPDFRQSQAVDVRSELDLRIGAAFTRFQTMRFQRLFPDNIEGLVSYGSCQIPTLGFVARRFIDVEKFIPQKFWKLKLTHRINDLTVEFTWARQRFFDEECCRAVLMLCQGDPTAYIVSVTKKPKSKWRPRAMDTIELEKLGSRKLKLSAKETMTIAEKLYTQGIISYPRTETNMFSKEINLRSLVENHTEHPQWGAFANRVLEWGPNPHNGNKSDQAHPPIHPTKLVNNLSGNEARVYELIVRHFLACVSKDATGSETTVKATVANEEFTAIGLVIYERNYLDVYIYDRWTGKEIHNYEQGQTFQPTELAMLDGQTSPPSLLTEADLIALMDKHGIGTDATHAEHINTIKTRGYIGEVNGGYLVPGTLGMGLVEGYDAVSLPLAYPELRAELERELKLICTGERDPNVVLRVQIERYKEAYKQITEKITAMDQTLAERFNTRPSSAPPPPTVRQTIEEIFKCPRCNQYQMAVRSKKDNGGYYISCLGRPGCNHVIWLTDIAKEISVENEQCQRCRNGAKKVNIKFKRIDALSALNSSCVTDENHYISCFMCDSNLKRLFDIDDASLRRDDRHNTTNNRPVLSSTTSHNTTTSQVGRTNARSSQVSRPPEPRSNNPVGNQWTRPPEPRNNNSGRNQSAPSKILCPKCRQPIDKQITRKEGANKGRPFFSCRGCNNFMWGDVEMPSNVQVISAGDDDNARASGSSWTNTNADNERSQNRAKRKCGICKQEGHTRTKCPRLVNTT